METKRRKSTTSKSPKKRRSCVLSMLRVNDDYVGNDKLNEEFRKDLQGKKPFPHWQLHNFVDNSTGIVEDVEQELQNYGAWRRKENDLYSLYQTEDFKALDSAEHPSLFSLRQFFYETVRNWLSEVSGIDLVSQVDMNGSCYSHTDGLLPHSDLIETRRFAFVYYLTPFTWNKEDGGDLHLFNSNGNDEPTSIATSLKPSRNSLVLFEVSQRSWHRVAEVLSTESPRLSVNGWFHSKRVLKARIFKPLVLPRFKTIDKKVDPIQFVSKNYTKNDKKQEIQQVFGSKSEIQLKQFLEEKIYSKVLNQLKKAKSTETGPLNKKSLNVCDTKTLTGESSDLVTFLSSNSAKDYLSSITGCELKDSKISLNVYKLSHGSYTIVGDEDVEQSKKDGFTLECYLYLGDAQWPDGAGGEVVYVGKDDDEELITVVPELNSFSLVLRDPEVFSFTKYANSKCLGELFVISLVFYNVPVDAPSENSDEDEETEE